LRESIGADSVTTPDSSGAPQIGQGGSNRPARSSLSARGPGRTSPWRAQV
jgi:hypothetical protein